MADLNIDIMGQPSVVADTGKTLNIGAGGVLGAVVNTDGSFSYEKRSAFKTTVTTVSTAGAVTYSAAQILGGLILRDPNGAGRADLIDTAANLIAGIPALSADGNTFSFQLINTADGAPEAITITTNTGLTIVNGTRTIDRFGVAEIFLRRTSSTAVTVYVA